MVLDGTFQMEAVPSVLVANSIRPEGLKQSELLVLKITRQLSYNIRMIIEN